MVNELSLKLWKLKTAKNILDLSKCFKLYFNEMLPKIIRTDMMSVCKHVFEIPQSYFIWIKSNYFVAENPVAHCIHFVTDFGKTHFWKVK